ncbi:MAG: pantoate--beta-alanine ligase [Lawsonella clevelandensis]
MARALHATSRQLILVPPVEDYTAGISASLIRLPASPEASSSSPPYARTTATWARSSTMERCCRIFLAARHPSSCSCLGSPLSTRPPHSRHPPGSDGDSTRPPGLAESLTVHAALLSLLRPARMFVGERDFYQLVTLRHLVKDLSLPTAVTGVNTLRDSNGMAISREIKDPRMAPALALSAALVAGAHAVREGQPACWQRLKPCWRPNLGCLIRRWRSRTTILARLPPKGTPGCWCLPIWRMVPSVMTILVSYSPLHRSNDSQE